MTNESSPCNYSMNVTVNSLLDQSKKIGYLKKLGGKGISKNWRKRFFVLTDTGILYYFKHRTSGQPVGAVDLSQYTKIYKDKTKKTLFFISNENDQNQRVFHLISENVQEMEDWILLINGFFECDLSDLKNHLLVVKQKKQYNTLTRTETNNQLGQYPLNNNIGDIGTETQSTKDETDTLDNYQLVFRGHRVSLVSNINPLLVNNESSSTTDGSNLIINTTSSPSSSSTTTTTNSSYNTSPLSNRTPPPPSSSSSSASISSTSNSSTSSSNSFSNISTPPTDFNEE